MKIWGSIPAWNFLPWSILVRCLALRYSLCYSSAEAGIRVFLNRNLRFFFKIQRFSIKIHRYSINLHDIQKNNIWNSENFLQGLENFQRDSKCFKFKRISLKIQRVFTEIQTDILRNFIETKRILKCIELQLKF